MNQLTDKPYQIQLQYRLCIFSLFFRLLSSAEKASWYQHFWRCLRATRPSTISNVSCSLILLHVLFCCNLVLGLCVYILGTYQTTKLSSCTIKTWMAILKSFLSVRIFMTLLHSEWHVWATTHPPPPTQQWIPSKVCVLTPCFTHCTLMSTTHSNIVTKLLMAAIHPLSLPDFSFSDHKGSLVSIDSFV